MRIRDGSSDVCSSDLDRNILAALHGQGTRLVALRCAGFNHVDLEAAEALEIAVERVPAYSPEAIAEHTVALILSLNRKLHRAYVRVREGNFALDGRPGFNLVKLGRPWWRERVCQYVYILVVAGSLKKKTPIQTNTTT